MNIPHTPEPWIVDERRINAEQGGTIGFIRIADCDASMVLNPDQKAANAKRIVSCVNACNGLTEYKLETLQEDLCRGEKASRSINDLLVLRDELVDALEKCTLALIDSLKSPEAWNIVHTCEALLKKAKGGENEVSS